MINLNIQKKSTILYIIKILKEGSDKNHPITQATIMRTLALLGISCDRKTVSRDIDCLIEYGYDIVKIKGGGCYYNSQDFTHKEVSTIMKCVDSADISPEEKYNLKKKIKRLANIYFTSF